MSIRFGVLGALRAETEDGAIELPGPRHRAVLARLLVQRGGVVPVARLIDDLWPQAPDGALGAVQTFVGALRKALEPDRAPRTPSRLLVTEAPGYALRAAEVDAWRFEDAVAESGRLAPSDARARLDDALALWRGPAYAEFADEPWARAEAARLEALRELAVRRRSEAMLALGDAAATVPELESQLAARPLDEDAWRLLVLALYRAGRQGDALATLRRARETLRDEAGLDPGAALRALEADVLAQAEHLTPAPPRAPRRRPFVGREDELARLEALAEGAAADARPRLALVSGSAGAGKTALAGALTERLGWSAVWDTGDELEVRPAQPLAERVAAAVRPTLLVLDDLHWAGEDTLALMTRLAADASAGALMILGGYRASDIAPPLAAALARAARVDPLRLALGGLDEAHVAELAHAVAGRELPPADARRIFARSAGHPFYARELTRVWVAEGASALANVPPGVRDVIGHRIAALPADARAHLRQAAIVGREVEIDVLVALAGDEDAVLASIESALLAGVFVEQDAERVRFEHALVHETVYEDIALARRVRGHAAVAAILESERPDGVEAIAEHLLRAGARADPSRLARHAAAAARLAERRLAPHAAARLWRASADALERADDASPRARLDASVGLVRALAVSGELDAAREQRGHAIAAAEALGDPLLSAEVIGADDVPAVWPVSDDPVLSARIAAAARRTLAALPSGHPAQRARLLAAIAMEMRADATGEGAAAAREAESIAREHGDPALLALALNARYMQSFARAGGAPQRAAIGEELLALAAEHDGLEAFAVLGHLVLIQSRSALADFAAADAHAAAVDALAEQHELPLVGVFTGWYAALRLAVAGEAERAGAAYRAADARMAGAGMPGMRDGLLELALATLDGGGAQGDHETPRDLLFEARAALAATAAIRDGDRAAMQRLYAQLLPAAGELAGAGSGALTLGPVALLLGDLATALGREDAREHYRTALDVATRAGAPHWVAAARRAQGQSREDSTSR